MGAIRKIFKQTFWQILAKAGNIFATVIALGFITRTYGPSGTGINTLALTYLAFFYLAADLGLNGHILSKLHIQPKQAEKLFNLRLYWSIFLACLSVALLPLLPFSGSEFNYSVILGSGTIVFFGIFTSTNLVFQYNHAYKFSALASLGSILVYLPVILFLIWINAPVEFLVLATLAGWFLIALLAVYFVERFYKIRPRFFNIRFALETLRQAWPISATIIINTVYFRVDAFILSTYRSISEVGNYNLAYQVFQNGIVLPAFIMNGYYPIMLKALRENKKEFINQFKLAFFAMFALGVVATILGVLLSPFIIYVLTGGGFEGAVISLRILSLSFPAFFLSALFIWTLIALNKYKTTLTIYIAGFLVNFFANYYYIPKYSYMGAAFVTCASEYLILTLQIIILLPLLKKISKEK